MSADGDNSVLRAQHTGLGNRARIVKAARDIFAYHEQTGRMHYTQSPLRMSIVRHKWRPPFHDVLFEDCSSYATACYWLAGLRDPNGYGYNGLGYTGTLCLHGKPVSAAQAKGGDLAFYGPGAPWHHVAVVAAKPGYVYSHGHEGGPFLEPLKYRADLGQIRTYL